jgi:hypothetical protein
MERAKAMKIAAAAIIGVAAIVILVLNFTGGKGPSAAQSETENAAEPEGGPRTRPGTPLD